MRERGLRLGWSTPAPGYRSSAALQEQPSSCWAPGRPSHRRRHAMMRRGMPEEKQGPCLTHKHEAVAAVDLTVKVCL